MIMASTSKYFLGIVTAAAVGAVIGLLFAPEEGNKVRKKIKKKTNSLASELIDALEKSKEKAETLKARGEKYADDVTEKAKDAVNDLSDDVRNI